MIALSIATVLNSVAILWLLLLLRRPSGGCCDRACGDCRTEWRRP